MTLQIVTANRLIDGIVVYRAAGGSWVENIAESALAETAEAAVALLAEGEASAARQEVVEPYLIPVAVQGGDVQPLSCRERIRATGPSAGSDTVMRAAAE